MLLVIGHTLPSMPAGIHCSLVKSYINSSPSLQPRVFTNAYHVMHADVLYVVMTAIVIAANVSQVQMQQKCCGNGSNREVPHLSLDDSWLRSICCLTLQRIEASNSHWLQRPVT